MSFQFDPVRPARPRRSFSINPENPTGEPGAAAREASALGVGRKGRPCVDLEPGATHVLADVAGPGVVRHIWLTCPQATETNPFVLRNLILEIWWDGCEEPSVAVPLGDFFCSGSARWAAVDSRFIVVAPTGGMNCYFAMPFRGRARIALRSEHPDPVTGIYYQVDGTLGDALADDTTYLHATWRRSNATCALGEDHVLLDGAEGPGAYLGSFISLTSLERFWWGEGEVKFYVDGDDDFPSLCSTGLEDYAGGAWAFQDALRADPPPKILPFSSHSFGLSQALFSDATGASPFLQHMPAVYSVYRWHEQDPIWFDSSLRVEVQQIGAWDGGLFERSDDLSTVAYWYATAPQPSRSALGNAASRRPR